jgi:hypothetical protein
MKTIVLKPKPGAPSYIEEKTISDDIVTGLIGNDYYIPVIHGYKPDIVFNSIQHLIDHYLWPVPVARLESFLKGHNPSLAATIEHYEVKDHQ